MSAKICYNYDDVQDFYYYKPRNPTPPDRYPVLVVEEDNDGGLMGCHRSYEYYYAPAKYTGIEAELAYLEGFQRARRLS